MNPCVLFSGIPQQEYLTTCVLFSGIPLAEQNPHASGTDFARIRNRFRRATEYCRPIRGY